MKKSCKVLFLLVLAVACLVSSALAADASIVYQGGSDGFGFQPGSDYTETDLFDNFKGVMPGDVLTQNISFTNSSANRANVRLYMRAVAHDETANPLSPKVAEAGETVASMTDFLAQLSMKVWNGSKLIYEASPDELDGLRENVLLGSFRSGETAALRVELTVPTTLGDDYADRVGEVDWVFHVEEYSDGGLIQTGQLRWPVWVLGGVGLALVVCGGVLLARKKRSNA